MPPIQIWLPLVETESVLRRDNHFHGAWAILAEGFDIEEAQNELDQMGVTLERAYPRTSEGWRMRLRPLQDALASYEGVDTFYLLLAAMGMVLLIGCANIANLQLSRATQRSHEIGLRCAIGGQRNRLIRQLVTENILLGLIGGVLGLLFAVWGKGILVAAFLAERNLWEPVALDVVVVSFCLGIPIICGFLFGLIPAMRIPLSDLRHVLEQGPGWLPNRPGSEPAVCSLLLR